MTFAPLIRVLVAAAVATAALPAQGEVERAQRPVAFDVHVLKVTSTVPEFIPTAEIVAAKRLMVDRQAGQREFRVHVGDHRFGVQIHDDGAGGVFVQREVGNQTRSFQPTRRTVDVADPWRWGRRPRHGTLVRGVMLCVPVADAGKAFAPLDVRGFLHELADVLLTAGPKTLDRQGHEQWSSPSWMAARVLGSFPLRDYLDAAEIDGILAGGDKLMEAGRLPTGTGNWFWPIMRPLIALAHRPTLEAIANSPEERHDELNGDVAENEVRAPSVPRQIEDSILIAYATAEDPAIRGLAGWVATGTRSIDVYDRLLADVRSGRAILPGDAVRREELVSHIVHARAWQSTTSPLLTLAGSALAIAAAMVLLRLLLRRML